MPLQTSLLTDTSGGEGSPGKAEAELTRQEPCPEPFLPCPPHLSRLPPQEKRSSKLKTKHTRTTWQTSFPSRSQAPPPQHAFPGVWGFFFLPRLMNRLRPKATWRHHLPPGVETPCPVLRTMGSPSYFLTTTTTPSRRGPCRNPGGPRPPAPRHPTALSAGPRRSRCRRPRRSSCRPSESPCAAWRPRGSPSPHGRQRGPSHRGGRRPAGGLGSEWAPVRSTVRGPWAGGRAGSFRGAGRARPRCGLRRRQGGPREASLDAAELLLSLGAHEHEGLRTVRDARGLVVPCSREHVWRPPVGRCYGRSRDPHFLDLPKTRVFSEAVTFGWRRSFCVQTSGRFGDFRSGGGGELWQGPWNYGLVLVASPP